MGLIEKNDEKSGLPNILYDNKPFFEMLDGISNKNLVFYTIGNSDDAYNSRNGKKKEFGEQLEKKGCKLLNNTYSITKNNDTLWIMQFTDLFVTRIKLDRIKEKIAGCNDKDELEALKLEEQYLLRYKNLWDEIKPVDIVVALTHYPPTRQHLESISSTNKEGFNLILAGHYHGGQIRIPFYGAIYIPAPTLPRSGWFPPQDVVSGLRNYGKSYIYISRGLGSSGSCKMLSFRLFNTPEINIITLAGKEQV